LIFGAKISKSCLFNGELRNEGGGGGGGGSGDLREVSVSVSGKNIPDTPRDFDCGVIIREHFAPLFGRSATARFLEDETRNDRRNAN